MKCPVCGHEVDKGTQYCDFCGAKLSENTASQNEKISESEFHQDIYTMEKVKKQRIVKNKMAWGILIVTCIILIFFKIDLDRSRTIQSSQNQLGNEENYKYNYKEISGNYLENDDVTKVSNLVKGGAICTDENHIYIANEKGITSFDEGFTSQKLIYEGNCSYLTIDDEALYFKDANKNGNILKYDLKTNEVSIIIEVDAYYLFIEDDYLYYQNDSDHESIYQYNIKTKETKKLNDEASYNIQIVDDYLYFSTQSNIQKIDLKTNEVSEVLNEYVFNMVVDDDKIYYISQSDGYIYCFDLKNQTKKRLNKEITYEFVLNDDDIYYFNSQSQIINMKTNGADNQWVNQDILVTSIYLTGDYIVYFDMNEQEWYSMDLNGEGITNIFNSSKNGKYI